MTELIDISTTARRLGIAKITLYKMVSARKIPFVKIGRRVLFNPEAIDRWITEHSTSTLRRHDDKRH